MYIISSRVTKYMWYVIVIKFYFGTRIFRISLKKSYHLNVREILMSGDRNVGLAFFFRTHGARMHFWKLSHSFVVGNFSTEL